MNELRFSDDVLKLFPSRHRDFHELEEILDRHRQITIEDLPLPQKGPDFLRQSLNCRLRAFAYTATIRSQRLLESVFRDFNEFNLHSVYVLVRSHLELAALVRHAAKNIRKFVEASDSKKLDEFLDKLVLGSLYLSKKREYPIKPFHIGNVVRELDEISPRVSQTYYFLTEFTHPNMGALILSAEMDEKAGVFRFHPRRPPSENDYLQTINLLVATGTLTLKGVSELLLLADSVS